MLYRDFFDDEPLKVAKKLLGVVIRHCFQGQWLSARIIETEAYYRKEKGSHASLGFTEKRKALFMAPGTIYMYYARGGDSLNISCRDKGNAVLIKSGYPYFDQKSPQKTMAILQRNNPGGKTGLCRPVEKLCGGQTLICRSLGLKVPDWDAQSFDENAFYFEDTGIRPPYAIQTTRLGIPPGRDEHLPYRLIDEEFIRYCTKNPLTMRTPPPNKRIRLN